jgi:two-component system response regulator VicR
VSHLICIIDDDEDVRDVLSYALELEGFQTLPFGDPFEAVDVLSDRQTSEQPLLIIVDYYMPHMNGVNFIKLLRERYPETLGLIPVVLSTAHVFEEGVTLPEGVRLSEKPWSISDLLEVINASSRSGSPSFFS